MSCATEKSAAVQSIVGLGDKFTNDLHQLTSVKSSTKTQKRITVNDHNREM